MFLRVYSEGDLLISQGIADLALLHFPAWSIDWLKK